MHTCRHVGMEYGGSETWRRGGVYAHDVGQVSVGETTARRQRHKTPKMVGRAPLNRNRGAPGQSLSSRKQRHKPPKTEVHLPSDLLKE